MFKNLLVPFVFGLAVAHTVRADPGDTCSSHADCAVSSAYASTNPFASSEEFCYHAGTYNGVTYGTCSDCITCSAGASPYGNSIDGSCPSKCADATSCLGISVDSSSGSVTMSGKKCWDSCPPLHTTGGEWCKLTTGQNVCCGDDCCEPNAGAIAGVAIGAVVGLTLLIVASCYCGRCGCFGYRRNQLIAAAVATRPQPPQVVYVQQAPAKVSV
jgi:hypothetical protein